MASSLSNLVTLKEVAAKAGVSRPVASKVLLGAGGNIRVSKDTQERVRSIAEELGYLANHAARQLRGKASRIVGVLIDSYAPKVVYHWLAELEREMAARGYMLMVGQSHGEISRLQQYADNFCGRGIDGVICLSHDYGGRGGDVVKILSRIRNIVFVGKPAGDSADIHYVAYDISEAIRTLVKHLYSTGRRRIGAFFYEDDTIGVQAQRLEGYKLGLQDVGLEFDETLIQRFAINDINGASVSDVERAVQQFAGPLEADAVIANNDLVAAQVISELGKHGKSVPGDVAVSGFDNMELSCHLNPPLTTVDLPAKAVAHEAINMLLGLIEGKKAGKDVRNKKLLLDVIMRESTGPKSSE